MSETKILLASLLKPINDTRMYEKLGLSLSKLEQAQIHIAGFSAPVPPDAPDNISFHPVFNFERISLGRIVAQKHYWKLLQSIRPDILVVCTHELLLLSILYKKRFQCKLVYDVQENYALNLRVQKHYAAGLRNAMAAGVRLAENLASKTVDHYLLAERSYATELPFIESKYTIIENKFKPGLTYEVPHTPVRLSDDPLKLIYSGTISAVYGVFEAVAFADTAIKANLQVHLTIIGYCADKAILSQLKKAIESKLYIILIGGEELVPHQQILNKISESDLGLMPYRYNPSTWHCVPTKLYEYAAFGKPVLIQANPLWDSLLNKYNAGLYIDFNCFDINALIPTLFNYYFYQKGVPKELFWHSEEQKLLPLFSHLIVK